MQYNVLLVLMLVSLNVISFLLLDVRKRFNVNKQKLWLAFAVLLCGVIIFLLFNSGEYLLMPFYISICLFCLLGVKFLMFRFFPRKKNVDKVTRIIGKMIDLYFMPFFVLHASIMQCMYLLVWNALI